MMGARKMTATRRVVCIAMTNGTSTLLDAAMMATESAPPGLVARYAVSGSTPRR